LTVQIIRAGTGGGNGLETRLQNDYTHPVQWALRQVWTCAPLCQPVQCWLSWGVGIASKRLSTMLDFLLHVPEKRQRYLPPEVLNVKPAHECTTHCHWHGICYWQDHC